MAIRFRCRGCFKGLEVPDSAAGTEAECPNCGRALVIPRPRVSASQRQKVSAGLGDSTWSGASGNSQEPSSVSIENPISTGRPASPADQQDDLGLLAADLAKNARVSQYANPERATSYPSASHRAHRSGKFRQLDRRKSQWPIVLFGLSICMLIAALAIFLSTRSLSFGRSFQVITDVSESGHLTMHGYSYRLGGSAKGFEAGAAFLVAVPGGVNLGGKHYPSGSVVLLSNEGSRGQPYFRLASPHDHVKLKQTISVKGKRLHAGRLNIKPGGNIAGFRLPWQSDRALVNDRESSGSHF